jgi:hypothetical protein
MTQTQHAQATRTRQTPKVMLVSELFEQPGDGGVGSLKNASISVLPKDPGT